MPYGQELERVVRHVAYARVPHQGAYRRNRRSKKLTNPWVQSRADGLGFRSAAKVYRTGFDIG